MDCVRWPGAHNKAGRPITTVDGYPQMAYIKAWEDEFGMPVPAGMELHHICENGWCINPFHLLPQTHTEHGRLHARKLTIKDARAMRELNKRIHPETGRRLYGSVKLASMYGVSRTMVRKILKGERWAE